MEESRVSVLIQEIPVVDRQGETTASECSQGRTRARHRKAENGGSECHGEEVEERRKMVDQRRATNLHYYYVNHYAF